VIRSAGSYGQYLTVELLTRDTSVGGEMRARISSTDRMDLLHYAVIGRGDILLAKTVEVSLAPKDFGPKFTTKILVFFFRLHRSFSADKT
jgi:hypothetical protein